MTFSLAAPYALVRGCSACTVGFEVCSVAQLCCEQVAVPRLIDEILDECSDQLCGHSVQVCIADSNLSVPADRQLLAMTITELLVNAAKYSSADSTIGLSAERRDGQVVGISPQRGCP